MNFISAAKMLSNMRTTNSWLFKQKIYDFGCLRIPLNQMLFNTIQAHISKCSWCECLHMSYRLLTKHGNDSNDVCACHSRKLQAIRCNLLVVQTRGQWPFLTMKESILWALERRECALRFLSWCNGARRIRMRYEWCWNNRRACRMCSRRTQQLI